MSPQRVGWLLTLDVLGCWRLSRAGLHPVGLFPETYRAVVPFPKHLQAPDAGLLKIYIR